MGDKRIPVSEELRDELKDRKRGDDTYEDVLWRILDGEQMPKGFLSLADADVDPDEVAREIEAASADPLEFTDATEADIEAAKMEILERIDGLESGDGVAYEDMVNACRKAIREELPDGVLGR